MNLREAAQQALEALERYRVKRQDFDRFADEITALRAALAENQRDWSLLEATQESLRGHMAEIHRLRAALATPAASGAPVAWMYDCGGGGTPLYTAQPAPAPAASGEPVAWIYQNSNTDREYLVWQKGTGGRNWRPLYTAPEAR